MITAHEALEIILNSAPIRDTKKIRLEDTNKHMLAKDIFALREQPPFDRVAMDGIAVNVSCINDLLPIEGIQAAGSPKLILKDSNKCIEAMTGAILPANTNCIIPYENISIENGTAKIDRSDLIINKNIHAKGSDYSKNDLLITKGTKITSPVSAVIASQGKREVEVYRRPKIAILSTGSELIDLNNNIKEHQIYMSNTYAIEHELKNFGFTDIERVHVSDDQKKTEKTIKELIDKRDILIITGGVSKGKFDFIPGSLKELGVEKRFHKIKQKPGKPMWYGTIKDKQVFALPGNPVSCLVCLRRYVLPSLNKSMSLNTPEQYGILTKEIVFKKDFTLFAPVIAQSTTDGTLNVCPISSNGSGDFNSLALSTGFIELDQNKEIHSPGDVYQYFPWS